MTNAALFFIAYAIMYHTEGKSMGTIIMTLFFLIMGFIHFFEALSL